jgi:formyl-CoA transferase/CoA:oxalate CoA-transferase
MDSTGFPDGLPVRCGVSFLDMSTGMAATLATVSALYLRERTGRGARCDASLLQTSLGLQSPQVSNFFQHGTVPQRMGTAHAQLVPYQAYPAADGHVFIASGNQNLYERFCRALDLEGLITDPRFKDNTLRVQNREPLLAEIHRAIARWKTDDLMAQLKRHGVPSTRVNSIRELMADGHVQAIGALASLEDPEFGPFTVSRLPFFVNGRAGRVDRRAPKLGEHTREVLAGLNYPPDKIEALLSKGVVRG